MDLFLDKYMPTFEKVAAEVALPEDPNQWPHELLQELHKQVSFISDFDPRIVMDRVDAEKGYGFGHFEVGNRMSDPNASQGTQAAAGAKRARIPIIIQEGRLKPFDLVITDEAKIFPLTEARLRRALFRPNMFDLDAKTPGDVGIIERLYPPMRQSNYVGGPVTLPASGGMVAQSAAGMGKIGMAKTAEEQWNDFVTSGETKEPGFTAWDGQRFETAGESDQRQRVRAEGDLEAAIGNDGVFGAVLSDQNRQTMGMAPRGPIAGTNGPQGYQKRQAVLHSIAGGRMKAAAVKLKTPEPEKIIEGQKAEGYKPQYVGAVGPDGSIKKRAAVEETPEQLKPFQAPVKRDKEERKDDKKEDKAVGRGLAVVDQELSEKERGKMLSKEDKEKAASVLSSILPTINESDFLSFAKACEPEEVKIALLRNTPAAEAVGKLAEWTPSSTIDIGRVAQQNVCQVSKLDDGMYKVKYASSRYWEPRTVIMDRGSLYSAVGDAALQVDLHGSITMVKGAQVVGDGPEADKPEPIEDFGMYKVQTTDGQKVVGFAIPNLIDLDGTSLPVILFTNGSASAVQGDMVGVRSGGEPNLPDGPEQGHGAFVHIRDNGKAEATVPIEIKAGLQDEKGQGWLAEDFNGQPVTIRKQPNLQMPVKVDDVVLLPESFRWMPLGGDSLELVDGVDAFDKQAEAVRHMLSVEVRGGSGAFSLDGPPVDKLAADERHFLDYDGAAFLLGGLGVDPSYAMKKLSEANFCGRPVRVRIGRSIKTAAARKHEAVKTAATRQSNQLWFYNRAHLVKEASVIPDPTAVDTVLSLGFLNPENITVFINALPDIEHAQSRLCELLLGARLGLKEVPEGALEKAVQATEDVLEGLRVLAFQET